MNQQDVTALFSLDEISDLPKALQEKAIKALEEGKNEPDPKDKLLQVLFLGKDQWLSIIQICAGLCRYFGYQDIDYERVKVQLQRLCRDHGRIDRKEVGVYQINENGIKRVRELGGSGR